MIRTANNHCVLLTGATGFIGHYLLADLLHRGVDCLVLLRPPLSESIVRLRDLMADLNIDIDSHIQHQSITLLAGDLLQPLPAPLPRRVDAVVHTAASTRFESDPTGEPSRTNVTGTLNLLRYLTSQRIRSLHLVSSAYQCGRARRPVDEQVHIIPPTFHNAYERTKWTNEQMARAWADESGGQVTIHRPSVVVGDFETGRASRFSGFYLVPRATEILANGIASHRTVDLRLSGRPDDHQNIVPVNYVAKMIGHIVTHSDTHGRVYHLTHPTPPTNTQIKSALEAHYDIQGGRFVDPAALDANDLGEIERIFYSTSEVVRHYFVDTPTFLRKEVEHVEQAAGISCPIYDMAAMRRMFTFASARRWGLRRPLRRNLITPSCAAYFETFLPSRVPQSQIAVMTALSSTMRFVIEDETHAQWTCRFDGGKLVDVARGPCDLKPDFTYRTRRDVFWRAVGGTVHPQKLFLTGDATISGNIEQGLKMAMILHAFTKEFPCTPDMLDAERSQACPAI